MEVFIREKNCKTCPFANKEKPNFICGDAIANDIGLKTNSSVCKLNYFANEENCPLKSLEQHDAEVRSEEKKKWQDKFDELEKYIKEMSYEVTASVGGFDYLVVDFEDLQQKLAELEKTPKGKGEKE